MKSNEPDIPAEQVDGDIAISLVEDCDEHNEADQEINNPLAYRGEPAFERHFERQSWSTPLGYIAGVW